jgi:hypothetical protein
VKLATDLMRRGRLFGCYRSQFAGAADIDARRTEVYDDFSFLTGRPDYLNWNISGAKAFGPSN